MTCSGCVANVKQALLKMPDVLNADVSLPNKAVVEMQRHLTVNQLQQAISPNGKYVITEDTDSHHAPSQIVEPTDASTSWLHTYKPLLLIVAFVAGVSHLSAHDHGSFDAMLWMRYFMAGFFLTFSFFKLLDLRGFASAYSSYDLLAKAVPAYGYVYPFIELALGLAYLTGFNPLVTNWVTVAVMGFSSIGVIQSVVNKQKIRCACLGAVFNLPMSTVTIVEDLSMVAMAALMLTTFHS
jgi:copper chaperone CopZ